MKVGHWVRTEETDFFKVILYVEKLHANNEKYVTSIPIGVLDIIKTANTPQELIQVGDLVEVKLIQNSFLLTYEVFKNQGVLYIGTGYHMIKLDFSTVIKIYTPSVDKSQYTLQWEVE